MRCKTSLDWLMHQPYGCDGCSHFGRRELLSIVPEKENGV